MILRLERVNGFYGGAHILKDVSLELASGEILGLRGGTLSELGQREAAIADLEAALADAERTGDALLLYRRLNDLALERLQRGETDAGQALLERAVEAAGRADVRPMVALGNLAALHGARGRPDLAVANMRELLELRDR